MTFKKIVTIVFILMIVLGAYGAYQLTVTKDDGYTQLINDYHNQRDLFNEYAAKAEELGMLKNKLFLETMIKLGNDIGVCERRLNINNKGISKKNYEEIAEIINGNESRVNEIITTINDYEAKVNITQNNGGQ